MPIGGFQSGFTPLLTQANSGALARSLAIRSAFNEPANSPAVINLVSAADWSCNRSSEFKEARPNSNLSARRVFWDWRRDLDAHCLSISIRRRRCFARKRREAKRAWKGANVSQEASCIQMQPVTEIKVDIYVMERHRIILMLFVLWP